MRELKSLIEISCSSVNRFFSRLQNPDTPLDSLGSDSFGNSWVTLTHDINHWIEHTIAYVPNMVVAIVFLIFVVIVSRWFRKLVRRIMRRFSSHEATNRLVSTLASVIFTLIGVFVTLSILGLEKAIASLLAGAGIAGIVIGLALQDTMANIFAGITLSLRGKYNIGDHIACNGHEGTIMEISLRNLYLLTFSGQRVSIPNKMVVETPVVNYSVTGARRVEVDCGIAYGSSLELVQKIVKEVLEREIDYDHSQALEFYYTSFGDSSINFKVRFWLSKTGNTDSFYAKSQSIKMIKRAFDAEGIVIPFPIRTLEFNYPKKAE